MAITVNSLGMEVRGLALGTNGQILSGSTRRAELLRGRAILKAWNHGWEDTPTSGTRERGRVGIINVWKNQKGQIWKCLFFLSFFSFSLALLLCCSLCLCSSLCSPPPGGNSGKKKDEKITENTNVLLLLTVPGQVSLMYVSCFQSLPWVVTGSKGSAFCRVQRANLRPNVSIKSNAKGSEVWGPPGWRGGGTGGASEVPTAQLTHDFGKSTYLDLSN